MKIILTGATGFVGSEVLTQLLQRPDIESITALTRRPLSVESPRLRTILLEDFTLYQADLADDLATHGALLWTLGGKASDEADPALYERITCTTTLACATAVASRVHHPFRFGYLSGMGADPSEAATFPWQKLTRHLKGRTERHLHQLTDQHHNFRATAFRPAGILPKSTSTFVDKLLAPIAIRVDHLAHAMIEETTRHIAERYAVLSNSTLRKIADPSH